MPSEQHADVLVMNDDQEMLDLMQLFLDAHANRPVSIDMGQDSACGLKAMAMNKAFRA